MQATYLVDGGPVIEDTFLRSSERESSNSTFTRVRGERGPEPSESVVFMSVQMQNYLCDKH